MSRGHAGKIVETYTMSQDLAGRRGRRQLALTLRLDANLDELVRQLSAAALVSKSKPKRATLAHGAVSVTITQEGAPE